MHARRGKIGFRYSAVTPSCCKYGSLALMPSNRRRKGRGGVAILQRMLPVAPNHLGTGRVMAVAAALDAVFAAAAGEPIEKIW